MISRILICASMAVVGLNGMLPAPPKPLTLREKMIERQQAKICDKKKLKQRTRQLCREWGYDR
jgi:hypothetical protein